MKVTCYKIEDSDEASSSAPDSPTSISADVSIAEVANVKPFGIATIQPKSDSTRSVVPHEFNNMKNDLLKTDRGGEKYSKYAAKLLMYLAGWSYSDLPAFETMMRRSFISGVDCLEITTKNDPIFFFATAQVIRSSDGEVAIVAFRGTELTNVISWLTDATTTTIKAFSKGIKVHTGFLRNFQAICKSEVDY